MPISEGRWQPDPSAGFRRRLGKSPAELGTSADTTTCPDIWELDNGDVAVVGRDLTAAYGTRLPGGVSVGADERLVIIPRSTILAAKNDLTDD